MSDLVPAGDLSRSEARDVTDKIRGSVEVVWRLVVLAYNGRAWLALGYESWDDYCAHEFGATRLRLPYEERQDVVASLREQGLSTRAIAAATGMGQRTVVRDLAGESFDSPGEHAEEAEVIEEQPVTGLDNKQHPRKKHGLYQRAAERRKKVLAYLEDHPDARVVEISEVMKVPQSTIGEDLRVLGVASTKSRAAVAHRREQIEKLAKTGATSHQIAKELGIEAKTVSSIARHHGMKIPGDKATRGQHRLVPDEVLTNFAGGLVTRVSNFETLMEGRWDEVGQEAGVTADVDLEQVITELRRVRRDLIAHEAIPDRWRRKRDDEEEQRQASINITPDMWREFKIKAQSSGDSAAAVLGRLVEAYTQGATTE